jgi:hypothetical protein
MKFKSKSVFSLALIASFSSVLAQAQNKLASTQTPAQIALASITANAQANIPATPQTVQQVNDQTTTNTLAAAQQTVTADKTILAKPIVATVNVGNRSDTYKATADGFVRVPHESGSVSKIQMSVPFLHQDFNVEFHANPDFPAIISTDGKALWMYTPMPDGRTLPSRLDMSSSGYSFTREAQQQLEDTQADAIKAELKGYVQDYEPFFEANGYHLDMNQIEVTDTRNPNDAGQCGNFHGSQSENIWTMNYLPYTITVTLTPRAN